MDNGEIVVVPFHDVGHTFPATELSLHLAARGYEVTLFLPSPSQPSPSPHPRIKIVGFSPSRPPPEAHSHPRRRPWTNSSVEDYVLSDQRPAPILCVIVDVMMSHLIEFFNRHGLPVVTLFTSSACSAALEHAMLAYRRANSRRDRDRDRDQDVVVRIPGLPEEIILTESYLRRRPHPPPTGRGPPPRGDGFMEGGAWGPPPPHPDAVGFIRGERGRRGPAPPRHGLEAITGSAALIFNTCEDLERPFLQYVSKETGKPVWGVGPLLPDRFWSSVSPVHDAETRAASARESNVSEREVQTWLETKPPGSVLYISFGTRVGPTEPELEELAAALGESDRPFVWVVQAGSVAGPTGFLDELAGRAGERGMVIHGWAPQLLILSHPSTGGFLTHCGWNSTVEALGCGVPMLTWPVGGDQIHNAKLVTEWLKAGKGLKLEDKAVTRAEVREGIEKLMDDRAIRTRARDVRLGFGGSFPKSAEASIDALCGFLKGWNGAAQAS